uniref:Unidentified orf n=1 Tax=Human herpesvirus 8 TaxID=37296 RepID=Q98152_HHV8|nr:unidentified orf [Human gammaherpesvirus 8]
MRGYLTCLNVEYNVKGKQRPLVYQNSGALPICSFVVSVLCLSDS